MQIVEVSVTGVRSAVITLQRDQSPMRFILFPMIHLGTPAFYQAVASRLRDTQLIVAEGIAGRSVVTSALTLSYRLPARRRRLNLVVQRIDHLGLGVPVIRPDITARQFRRRWRAVPALQRMAVWCLIPRFAIAVWLFGTRRVMGRYLSLDDLPTSEAQTERDIAVELVELIVDHRDALLVDALVSIHEARSTEPIAVAVVYGAGHMPAVVRALLARYGYRPRAAEWLTVFDF